jgi:hypothetical protein
MRCVNCSAEIPAGARNCTRCGVPVSASATPGQYGAPPAGGPYAGAPSAPGVPSAPGAAWPQAPQYAGPGYPAGGVPQPGLPQQGLPQQGLPQQGLPQQGLPQQGLPQQGLPQQGMPQQGLPQQGMPQQGLPQQGMPQQGLPQQGMPQQGLPQQGLPQPGMPQPGMPGWQPGGGGYVPQRAPMDPALRRRRLILASAILAFAGGVFIFIACAVPFASVSIAGSSTSVSVFSRGPGSGNAGWFVLEPVFVALLAIAAGSVIMVVREGWMPTVARIALGAFGIQTFFLFLGYSLGYATTGVSVGAGGPLGLVAGVALALSGAIGVLLLRDQGAKQYPNPAPGPAMPPSGIGPGAPVPPYRPA